MLVFIDKTDQERFPALESSTMAEINLLAATRKIELEGEDLLDYIIGSTNKSIVWNPYMYQYLEYKHLKEQAVQYFKEMTSRHWQ